MVQINDNGTKHLEFIEQIIARQAHNSFTIKGWALTLSAGIFTFLLSQDPSKEVHPYAYFIASMPAVLFWFLDAYYLALERSYRCLYDDVRKSLLQSSTGSNSVEPFELNGSKYRNSGAYWNAFRSLTVVGIPLAIIGTSILLFVIDNGS